MAVSSLVPAASGPTLAEIQTAVSTYSKGPLDITWTQIGYTNPGGTATCTFSSLGGYKYIKLVGILFNSSGGAKVLGVRINGDATGSMYINGNAMLTGSSSTVGTRSSGPNSRFELGYYGSGYDQNYLELEFINPTQTTGKKMMQYSLVGYDGSEFRDNSRGTGIYNSNNALTSISLFATDGSNFGSGNGSPTGFYIYGAN